MIWGVCGLCCGLELEDVVSTSACLLGRNVCTGAWGLITVQMAQIKTRVVRFKWDSVSWSKIAAGVRWLTTKSCAQVQQQSAFHCGPHVCMKPKTQNVNTLCKNKWLLTTNRKLTQPYWQFFVRCWIWMIIIAGNETRFTQGFVKIGGDVHTYLSYDHYSKMTRYFQMTSKHWGLEAGAYLAELQAGSNTATKDPALRETLLCDTGSTNNEHTQHISKSYLQLQIHSHPVHFPCYTDL